MTSIKAKLMRPLHAAALFSGASARLALQQPRRRILMLHNVAPGHFAPSEFERQLVWLSRHFHVVSLPQMVAEIEAGIPVQGLGQVALTFDDGLRNHAEIVYPLLQRHSMPATFFACPSLIETGRWLWNHEARARLRIMSTGERAEIADKLRVPSSDIEEIIGWMKTLPMESRSQAEHLISEQSPAFNPTSDEHSVFDPMSWNQLRALDPTLITVGAHSSSHPILTTLDDATLEQEIVGSRRLLERAISRPVDIFCYPNGDNDARARHFVRTNFRAGVTTTPGIISSTETIEALPRIPASPRLALTAWRIHRPSA